VERVFTRIFVSKKKKKKKIARSRKKKKKKKSEASEWRTINKDTAHLNKATALPVATHLNKEAFHRSKVASLLNKEAIHLNKDMAHLSKATALLNKATVCRLQDKWQDVAKWRDVVKWRDVGRRQDVVVELQQDVELFRLNSTWAFRPLRVLPAPLSIIRRAMRCRVLGITATTSSRRSSNFTR
jgi:hypothetical protein